MVLTRAVDNRLKQFFIGSDVQFEGVPFQGKGFRSLGQEAIYAAAIRLRRGAAWRDRQRGWQGDVVGPIIRDLGVALAMRPEPATVRMVLNAQMAKDGPPMGGKDLHIGDWEWGILPATAPLSISTMSIAGIAMAFAREGSQRVAVSFIGDGGSSLGEWHEAINLCAARRLPAIFCIENNQIALSTPLSAQSAVRVFADKARGYGIPGITIDGTDPDEVAAAFTWAADRARAGARSGAHRARDACACAGTRITTTCCIWARSRRRRGTIRRWRQARTPTATPTGAGRRRIRSRRTPRGSRRKSVIAPGDLDAMKQEAASLVEAEARAVIDAPWPNPEDAARGVFADDVPRVRLEPLEPSTRLAVDLDPGCPTLDEGLPFDKKGHTFLDAVALGVGDALRSDPRVFVYGEDVGGRYGNAFLLLRPLLEEFGDRIINSPLAESGVLGVCVGAALAGQRPIGEMQFNDFVASGFNQLVNNAAKIRYRWGGSVPMVVRMPWGGLRHAGPYHSQNTEPWFYRTPGLKIVAPSTPQDARALMAAAVADPDPVLYYEHIALYRDPRIKQALPDGRARSRCRSAGRRCVEPATTWRSSRTARTCTSRCAWRARLPQTGFRPACSTCARSCRSTRRRCCASPATAAAC